MVARLDAEEGGCRDNGRVERGLRIPKLGVCTIELFCAGALSDDLDDARGLDR